MKSRLFSLLAGLLFGGGLVLSGMTQPSKVIGFLDLAGAWDPSLALVMVGAIAVHFVLLRVVLRRNAPLFEDRFHLPTRRDIDARLISGAVLFGTLLVPVLCRLLLPPWHIRKPVLFALAGVQLRRRT